MGVDERAQLAAWIEGSLRFRRKLKLVSAIAAALVVVLWWRSSTVGIVAGVIVGAVYGAGWWITYGHISDWQNRIELLDRRARARR